MGSATFRFYAELCDFLPPAQRGGRIVYHFQGSPAVKDAVESIGVPHPEVELLLCSNSSGQGRSVKWSHPLQDGDHISAFPRFRSFEITEVSRVLPTIHERLAFVLDGHLARLAAYLRLMGFDTLWTNPAEDHELARISVIENRILLTRDIGLLKRSIVLHGYWIRETLPREQLREASERFGLASRSTPFTRCMACNGLLRSVPPLSVVGRIPAGIQRNFREFTECKSCRRIYWKGSHFDKMIRMIEGLKELRPRT